MRCTPPSPTAAALAGRFCSNVLRTFSADPSPSTGSQLHLHCLFGLVPCVASLPPPLRGHRPAGATPDADRASTAALSASCVGMPLPRPATSDDSTGSGLFVWPAGCLQRVLNAPHALTRAGTPVF